MENEPVGQSFVYVFIKKHVTWKPCSFFYRQLLAFLDFFNTRFFQEGYQNDKNLASIRQDKERKKKGCSRKQFRHEMELVHAIDDSGILLYDLTDTPVGITLQDFELVVR